MKDQVKADLEKMKKEADMLQKIYTQQDELLGKLLLNRAICSEVTIYNA